MPKLWTETIATHRLSVRTAILDTAAALVAEHGLRPVTMSQIAEEAGIGRATLYKYFPSVEAILLAWHSRQMARHLEYLAEVRERAETPRERLEAVLAAYASVAQEIRGHHDAEVNAFLHGDATFVRAQHELQALLREVLAEGRRSGDVRQDVALDELANYCLHALGAARSLPTRPAVRRLVALTLAGVRG
jgi:AcrR family transcriptional regulator